MSIRINKNKRIIEINGIPTVQIFREDIGEWVGDELKIGANTLYEGDQLKLNNYGSGLGIELSKDPTSFMLPVTTVIDPTGTIKKPVYPSPQAVSTQIVQVGTDNIEAVLNPTSGMYEISVSIVGAATAYILSRYITLGDTLPTDLISFSPYESTDASDIKKRLFQQFIPLSTFDGKIAGDEVEIVYTVKQDIDFGKDYFTLFESNQPFSFYGTGTEIASKFDVQIYDNLKILDETDYRQRQIIRSGVKGNFSVSSITGDTQVQITAETGGEFEVYFNTNADVDDTNGFGIQVPDQAINVINHTSAKRYHISVDSTGTIFTTETQTDIGNLSRVHLCSYAALNGELIPSSLIANPYLSYSDKTLQAILSTEGVRVNNLRIDSKDNTTLGLKSSAFTLIANAINYELNKINPHDRNVDAKDPFNWTYLTQDVTIPPSVGTEVLLDPTQYDNGGTLTPVAGGINRSTVQLVMLTPVKEFIIMYGQEFFDNYEDAITNTRNLKFILPPGLSDSVEVARIVMKRSATDSADVEEVSIFNTSGGAGGGSGETPDTTVFFDGDFELKNSTDDTKRARLSASLISTATTNIYNLPIYNGNIARERDSLLITSGTSAFIGDGNYNRDTVIYLNSTDDYTLNFSDLVAKANAQISIILLNDFKVTVVPQGALKINDSSDSIDFIGKYKRIDLIQRNGDKNWYVERGEQTVAYVKFNPNKFSNGEVNYLNAGVGFRVFKIGTGIFQVENDGTILNNLSSNWAIRAASGSNAYVQIGSMIAGINGYTMNIETWSSSNGPQVGYPGSITIFIRSAAGGLVDVANTNGHVYIKYLEI